MKQLYQDLGFYHESTNSITPLNDPGQRSDIPGELEIDWMVEGSDQAFRLAQQDKSMSTPDDEEPAKKILFLYEINSHKDTSSNAEKLKVMMVLHRLLEEGFTIFGNFGGEIEMNNSHLAVSLAFERSGKYIDDTPVEGYANDDNGLALFAWATSEFNCVWLELEKITLLFEALPIQSRVFWQSDLEMLDIEIGSPEYEQLKSILNPVAFINNIYDEQEQKFTAAPGLVIKTRINKARFSKVPEGFDFRHLEELSVDYLSVENITQISLCYEKLLKIRYLGKTLELQNARYDVSTLKALLRYAENLTTLILPGDDRLLLAIKQGHSSSRSEITTLNICDGYLEAEGLVLILNNFSNLKDFSFSQAELDITGLSLAKLGLTNLSFKDQSRVFSKLINAGVNLTAVINNIRELDYFTVSQLSTQELYLLLAGATNLTDLHVESFEKLLTALNLLEQSVVTVDKLTIRDGELTLDHLKIIFEKFPALRKLHLIIAQSSFEAVLESGLLANTIELVIGNDEYRYHPSQLTMLCHRLENLEYLGVDLFPLDMDVIIDALKSQKKITRGRINCADMDFEQYIYLIKQLPHAEDFLHYNEILDFKKYPCDRAVIKKVLVGSRYINELIVEPVSDFFAALDDIDNFNKTFLMPKKVDFGSEELTVNQLTKIKKFLSKVKELICVIPHMDFRGLDVSEELILAILNNASSARQIHFEEKQLTHKVIEKISHIRLSRCEEISVPGDADSQLRIQDALQKASTAKLVTINHNSEEISEIIDFFPEYLICPYIEGAHAHLKSLNINFSADFDDEKFGDFTCNFDLLKKITIGERNPLRDHQLHSLLLHSPNIESLFLTGNLVSSIKLNRFSTLCLEKLTEVSIKPYADLYDLYTCIFNGAPSLKTLKLGYAKDYKLPVMHQLSQLKSLVISDVMLLQKVLNEAVNIEYLTLLNMSVWQLTSNSFELQQPFYKLTYLCLKAVTLPADYILVLLKNCPVLKFVTAGGLTLLNGGSVDTEQVVNYLENTT